MWKRTLVATLVALLLAGPALARDGRRHRGAHARWQSVELHRGGHHGRHHGAWRGYRVVHRHHDHHDVAEALFVAGAVAVGLTALVAISQPPPRREPAVAAAGWAPIDPPPTDAYAEAYDTSYCREFQRDVEIGGRVQRAYGTACLQDDGSWKVVD